MNYALLFPAVAFCLFLAACSPPEAEWPDPPFSVVDMNIGESREVVLADGTQVELALHGIEDIIDSVASVVRASRVMVTVNGEEAVLISANYNLPVEVGGVQIDCPITASYQSNSRLEPWALERDARLRIWPAGSPWLPEGSFYYPIRQRWFASYTQMANEPVHVDGGEVPGAEEVYYHSGLDFGGAEGMIEAVSAVEGLVVTSGDSVLSDDLPDAVNPRYDVVYLRDDRGWYYRYSHLYSIDASIVPGAAVSPMQQIGLLGKEGGSGGWSHLHFEVVGPQPSGEYGTIEGYGFIWEAYLRQYDPDLIAVARPHHVAWTGDTIALDGSRSWSAAGSIDDYEWQFDDGSSARGATASRTYDQPGTYAEVLQVTDPRGSVAYDVVSVQILDRDHPDRLPPTIHPAYAPTMNLEPGTPITFKVRTFRTTHGEEIWDFGDGSEPVRVQSDGNADIHAPDGYAETTHFYDAPGTYLVRVERRNEWGYPAIGKLVVTIE